MRTAKRKHTSRQRAYINAYETERSWIEFNLLGRRLSRCPVDWLYTCLSAENEVLQNYPLHMLRRTTLETLFQGGVTKCVVLLILLSGMIECQTFA
jgi:hypothetical protein